MVQLTIAIVVQGFPTLVPFVKRDLHLSLTQAGIFATTPAVGMLIGLIAVGAVIDRLGTRNVLVSGAIVTGVFALVAAAVHVFAGVLIVSVVLGLGAATATPAGASALMTYFERRQRGMVMGIWQTGLPVGGGLAALSLPWVASAIGWQFALAVTGAVALVGAVTCLVIYSVKDLNATRSASPATESPVSPMKLVSVNLVTISGCGALLIMAHFTLVSDLVLYVHQQWAVSLVYGSLLLAATQFAGGFGRILAGVLSDKIFTHHRARTLMFMALSAAASILVLAWLPRATPLAIVAVVALACGAAAIGWSGVYITLLAEIAPSGDEGRSVAIGMTLNQPGVLIGPTLFGAVVDVSGSFRVGWTLLAIILVAAALLTTRVSEPAAVDP